MPPEQIGPSGPLQPAVLVPVDAYLGGQHHLVTPAADRPGDEPLALAAAAVGVGRVQMVHPSIERRIDHRHGRVVGQAPLVIPASGQQPKATGETQTSDGPSRRNGTVMAIL